MKLDWITVAAQIVNFLILVWLLRRFLYDPVIRAMERREERIAARLQEAEDKKVEAEKEAKAFRDKQVDLERQSEEVLVQARKEAEEERRCLERAAREETDQQRREWMKLLEDHKNIFVKDLRRRSMEHFYALARQALAELADTELDGRMATVFTDRLHKLDRETQDKLQEGCRRAGGVVTVSSGFELAPEVRRRITRAVHEHILEGAEVTYEKKEEIACGIELKAGSQVISWNLDSYFDQLEQAISEEISTEAAPAVGDTGA